MEEGLELDSLVDESQDLGGAPDPKALHAQKQHWREKAQKEKEARLAAEAKVKEYEERIAGVEKTSNETSNSVEEIKLRSEHGLDDLDLKILKGLAVGAGKKPHEMIEDEAFKEYQEGRKSKSRIKEAIPTPSTRVPVVGEKSFMELSPEERKQNYAKTTKALIDKAKNSNRSIT